MLGVTRRRCSESFAASDDRWRWQRRATGFWHALITERLNAWDNAATKSLAVVSPSGPPARPIACVKWEGPDFDA